MEELAVGIGGAVIGAGVWLAGNLCSEVGYALSVRLLVTFIVAGMLLAGLATYAAGCAASR